MTGIGDHFEQFRDQVLSSGDRVAEQQENFEETCVKRLLAKCGVSLRVGLEKGQANEKYGTTALDFDWLKSEYPAFPTQLATEKMRHTAPHRWVQLFGSGFAKMPWFDAYQRAATRLGWDVVNEPCVLLFNAPKAGQAGTMSFHNHPGMVGERPADPQTRITRPYGNQGIVYVIEPLSSLVTTFGTEWVSSRCQ